MITKIKRNLDKTNFIDTILPYQILKKYFWTL